MPRLSLDKVSQLATEIEQFKLSLGGSRIPTGIKNEAVKAIQSLQFSLTVIQDTLDEAG